MGTTVWSLDCLAIGLTTTAICIELAHVAELMSHRNLPPPVSQY